MGSILIHPISYVSLVISSHIIKRPAVSRHQMQASGRITSSSVRPYQVIKRSSVPRGLGHHRLYRLLDDVILAFHLRLANLVNDSAAFGCLQSPPSNVGEGSKRKIISKLSRKKYEVKLTVSVYLDLSVNFTTLNSSSSSAMIMIQLTAITLNKSVGSHSTLYVYT